MPRLVSGFILICLFIVASASAAESSHDWPGWRGPQRTGRSAETGLLASWPDGGPRLLWTATGLGEGFSSPSVVGDLIYVMGNRDGKELVLALDRTAQGDAAWVAVVGDVRHDGSGHPGPRSTPTVDGNRVYALGLNGDLVCLDAQRGKQIWRHDLVADFDGQVGTWGYSESVLVDGPWVLCTPGGQAATLLALNKTNGKRVWQSKIGDTADYSSIIAIEAAGVKQYVQFTKQGVIGVSAKNGQLLWRYDAPANGTANVATPVFSDDSVFAASGYGAGGGLVRLKKKGRKFDAEQVYFTKEMKNHHGGLVLVDGSLYGCDDPGVLTCLDFATGEVKWRERSCGKCSLVYADGMLYCRSEQGVVSLVRATPERFELAGRFEQPQRSDRAAWPHPVVADGRLYLRDQDKLFCYDVRASGT